MKPIALALTLCFVLSTGVAAETPIHPDLNSLIETERAFCQRSTADGTRVAFLAFLADDAVVFSPQPVPGKEYYSERPPSNSLLTWTPVFADISQAGDLGYTTGPWEFKINRTDTGPAAYGHYVTIWRRAPGQSWRAVIDAGIPHPKPENPAGPLSLATTGSKGNTQVRIDTDAAAQLATLMDLDRAFSEAATVQGVVGAHSAFSDEAVRFYRPNHIPFIGKQSMRSFLSQKKGHMKWNPASGGVSRSGDLGYTYGTSQHSEGDDQSTELSSYLHIWKKQASGTWKLVLDVANPLPASSHGEKP